MTPKLPLRVGSYDDGGQVSDANGNDLFTFGCSDDTKEMDESTKEVADWVLHRVNHFDGRFSAGYRHALDVITDLVEYRRKCASTQEEWSVLEALLSELEGLK